MNMTEAPNAQSDFHCISVMQPYFFPYIGYFQLIYASDVFVIYDDGKMIKNGYIHKNSILSTSSEPSPFTVGLTLSRKSANKKINEIELSDDRRYLTTVLQSIDNRYKRAPCFKSVIPILSDLILQPESNLARYLTNQITAVCNYIGINTSIALSSDIDKSGLEYCEEKAFRICRRFGMENYINPLGGQNFYDRTVWKQNGINLYFLKRDDDISYRQFKETFVPDLSIIDVMMFNYPEQIRELLRCYTLL